MIQALKTSRFLFLMMVLLGYMAIAPLLTDFAGVRLVTDVLFSATLLSTIYAVSRKRYQAGVATVLALPFLFAIWEVYFEALPDAGVLFYWSEIFFFGYTGVLFLTHIFRADRIDLDVVFAAAVVYLFLGLTWAGVHAALEHYNPGSYTLPDGFDPSDRSVFPYFSFVTLSTLGYGDISPVTRAARSMAALEAIIGQLYLALLIARIVGIHASQSIRNSPTGGPMEDR